MRASSVAKQRARRDRAVLLSAPTEPCDASGHPRRACRVPRSTNGVASPPRRVTSRWHPRRAERLPDHATFRIESATCSPERTAPLINPCISVARSEPAQWMRPTGSRTAEPHVVSNPGVRRRSSRLATTVRPTNRSRGTPAVAPPSGRDARRGLPGRPRGAEPAPSGRGRPRAVLLSHSSTRCPAGPIAASGRSTPR